MALLAGRPLASFTPPSHPPDRCGYPNLETPQPGAPMILLRLHQAPDLEDRLNRLTAAQKAELAAWVEAGPDPERDGVVRWRCADLKRRIEAEFGVVLHERSVGKHLAALGLRRLSVRPQHPKADPAAQTAFKKTSATR
jgi:hypothetical protein